MALTFPNIPSYDYIPVIKDLSTGQTTYIVNEYSAPESIEEVLGVSQYKPEGKWWEGAEPLLSVIQRNKVATIPSVLVGEALSTSADVLEAFQSMSDGTVNFAGLLSAISGRNVIGYVAAALGFSIAKDSYDAIPDFWDNVSKAVFGGQLRDKDIKAPTLIKDGKTYVPKKMIAAIRKALYDAGLVTGALKFPTITETGLYTVNAFANSFDVCESILKEAGLTINEIKYGKSEPAYNLWRNSNGIAQIGVIDRSASFNEFAINVNMYLYTPNTPIEVTVNELSDNSYVFYINVPASTTYVYGNTYYKINTGVWDVSGLSTSVTRSATSFSCILGSYAYTDTYGGSATKFGNANVEFKGYLPTFTPTGDISEATTPLEDAYPTWAGSAIGFPAKVGTDEKEEWYPLTIPDAIPWSEGYDGTKEKAQEKAQEGTLTKDRTETKDEVLDNTLPGAITKPATKTDVRPNPTPAPLPSIPTNVPSVDLGLAQLYNPTLSQLKSFSRWLWGTDFDIDLLKKLFADPMQAIIGLHAIYATPKEGGTSTIQVGYINSGVASQVVREQFTTINCGTVHIPESFGDVRDYSPYTKVSIYLPFIGIQELNTDDIMGSDITVTYKVDVLTGACIALLSLKSKYVNGILYSFTGNCAIQLPISSGGYMQTILSLVGAVSSAVAKGALGGAVGAVGGAVAGLSQINKSTVTVTGSLSSNAGALGVKKPYIIIRRPRGADAASYNEFYGYPANTFITLSQLSGFCRVKDINLSISGATAEEQNEIIALLKEGVIL